MLWVRTEPALTIAMTKFVTSADGVLAGSSASSGLATAGSSAFSSFGSSSTPTEICACLRDVNKGPNNVSTEKDLLIINQNLNKVPSGPRSVKFSPLDLGHHLLHRT